MSAASSLAKKGVPFDAIVQGSSIVRGPSNLFHRSSSLRGADPLGATNIEHYIGEQSYPGQYSPGVPRRNPWKEQLPVLHLKGSDKLVLATDSQDYPIRRSRSLDLLKQPSDNTICFIQPKEESCSLATIMEEAPPKTVRRQSAPPRQKNYKESVKAKKNARDVSKSNFSHERSLEEVSGIKGDASQRQRPSFETSQEPKASKRHSFKENALRKGGTMINGGSQGWDSKDYGSHTTASSRRSSSTQMPHRESLLNTLTRDFGLTEDVPAYKSDVDALHNRLDKIESLINGLSYTLSQFMQRDSDSLTHSDSLGKPPFNSVEEECMAKTTHQAGVLSNYLAAKQQLKLEQQREVDAIGPAERTAKGEVRTHPRQQRQRRMSLTRKGMAKNLLETISKCETMLNDQIPEIARLKSQGRSTYRYGNSLVKPIIPDSSPQTRERNLIARGAVPLPPHAKGTPFAKEFIEAISSKKNTVNKQKNSRTAKGESIKRIQGKEKNSSKRQEVKSGQ